MTPPAEPAEPFAHGGGAHAGTDDLDRARALLAAGLACLDAATTAWLAHGATSDPTAVLDELMQQLEPA